jgi:hypothetical protein
MSRVAYSLAVAGALAALSLIGCNAVLGIDEAHSRDSAVSNSKSLVIPAEGCDIPQTECAKCVSGSNALISCMGDHDCRKSLDAYRQCLGSKCENVACFDALSVSAGSAVADVVHAECPVCEGTSPLASMCNLYCACMQQTLPTPAGAVADGMTCEAFNDAASLPWAAGTLVACTDACKKLDLASLNCRWSHCELANNGETRAHCQHAISEVSCPLAVAADADCTDKKPFGWGCDVSKDCCSNRCIGNICQR